MIDVLFLTGPENITVAEILFELGWHLEDVRCVGDIEYLADQTLPRPLAIIQRGDFLGGEAVRSLFDATCWFCVAEGAPATIVLGAGFDESTDSIRAEVSSQDRKSRLWGAQTWPLCIQKALGLHKMDPDRRVTVCSECLRTSCWMGWFLCDLAKAAGVLELPVWALEKLELEHSDYWEPEAPGVPA